MSNPTESLGMQDPLHPAIPISKGIPPILRWFFFFGIVLVVIIISLVVWQSYYGHVWPESGATHIRLTPNGTGPTPAGEPIGQ